MVDPVVAEGRAGAWQQQLAAESAAASEQIAFGTRFAELKKLADRLAPPFPDDADAPEVAGGAVRGKVPS